MKLLVLVRSFVSSFVLLQNLYFLYVFCDQKNMHLQFKIYGFYPKFLIARAR